MKPPPISAAEVLAMSWCVARHEAQAYGYVPHVVHCAEVRRELSTHGFHGPVYEVAPWLHDLVEDTDTTREEIIEGFGAEVGEVVWAVSGMPKGAPRRVRVADAYVKIRAVGARAGTLKLADRIVNARASRASAFAEVPDARLFEMYQDELGTFEAMLDAAGAVHGPMRKKLRALLLTPRRVVSILVDGL